MDDERAIARLRQGDIDALEPLVRRYQQRAIRAAFLITRDVALAEDIVQNAFLRTFERIHQLRSADRFAAWFMRGVVNDATRAVSRQRHVPLPTSQADAAWDDAIADPDPVPEDILTGIETREELWDALARLPAAQRAAIIARYYLGLSDSEVAAHADIPLGTVKWRLHSGRAHLKRILAPRLSQAASSQPSPKEQEQSSQ